MDPRNSGRQLFSGGPSKKKRGILKCIKMILFQIVDIDDFKNISPFAKNRRVTSEMETHIIKN